MQDSIYYDILGISRSATDSDVKNAYRRAAFKWHPEKFTNEQEKELAVKKFAEIAEAYVVLSDKKLHLSFDKYGLDGLHNGVDGNSGWNFNEKPMDVYISFFGDSAPLAHLNCSSVITNTSTKNDPLFVNVYASLHELQQGAVKQVKIVRQVIVDGEKQPQTKIVQVTINPGWKDGTKLTFPGAGDEEVNMDCGDAILVIKEKPHPHFRREKNDLVYNTQISLLKSLVGCVVDIDLLDGRILPVGINEVVKPNHRIVIPNEGMPFSKDPSVKGNLIVEIDVVYPDVLSIKQKEQLALILPQ